MNIHKGSKTLLVITALLGVTILSFAAGCSSNEETLKPLGSNDRNDAAETENRAQEIQSDTTVPSATESSSDPEEQGGRPMHRLGDDPYPPPELATRPADLDAQMWWVLGQPMRWWFQQEADFSTTPEVWIGIWSDPVNSDAGSPEIAASLVEAGKQATVEWVTATKSDGSRVAIAPAEGVQIQAAAAAKAYGNTDGQQLYRVAVLWSAAKGGEFGLPVNNQITEIYFAGSPGNWVSVPCQDAGPTMCVPLFQTVI